MPLPGRGGRTGKGCEGGTRLLSPLPTSAAFLAVQRRPLQLRTSGKVQARLFLLQAGGSPCSPKALGAQRPAPVEHGSLTQVTPTSTPQAARPAATGSPESIGACWGRAMWSLSALTGDPRLPGPCAQHWRVALARGPSGLPHPQAAPSSHCGAGAG